MFTITPIAPLTTLVIVLIALIWYVAYEVIKSQREGRRLRAQWAEMDKMATTMDDPRITFYQNADIAAKLARELEGDDPERRYKAIHSEGKGWFVIICNHDGERIGTLGLP